MSELTPPGSPPPAAPPAAPATPATPSAAPPARSVDDIKRDPLVAAAVSRVDDAILNAKEQVGEITLFVDRDRIVEVCREFKNDGFVYLVDLAGVDYSKYPNHTGLRFSVAYTLYSFAKNARVRLRQNARCSYRTCQPASRTVAVMPLPPRWSPSSRRSGPGRPARPPPR